MNIKFLLDDFEVIGSVEKSIEALKVKLFEPHSVGEKKISYIVFTGDAVELNKQFHYYDTSEKSKLLGKKISFNLKINPPSEQFYNYNEEIGSSNPWANRS
jgi:hypothetical protein